MENIDIKDLFEEEKNEVAIFDNEGNITKPYIEVINEYLSFSKKAKELEANFKEALLKAMEEKGYKSIKNDYFTITYTAPTIRKTFDTDGFKFANEEEYNKWLKVSNVKSKITIKQK